jgi:hypothetical protein
MTGKNPDLCVRSECNMMLVLSAPCYSGPSSGRACCAVLGADVWISKVLRCLCWL